MELLRLKKRLILARRGHKLLKDKQDELMSQLLGLVERIGEVRREVETRLEEVYGHFLSARMSLDDRTLEAALSFPGKVVKLKATQRLILNIRVPVLKPEIEGKIYCYGFASTPGDLDVALKKLEQLLEKMIQLAEMEKTLQLLADEIERTRRRVNALEYVLIPDLQEAIKYITMKLEEMERESLTRLMRVKEIIRGE